MSDTPDWLAPLRFILRIVFSILLILWTLLDSILSPIFRPLLDGLSGLGLFAWIGGLIGRLPPYVALLVFAVPFIVIEPVKAFALYWLGIGHVIQGGTLYVLAHLASILIVERIYHAAHEPLMRIGWFRQLMTWLDNLRRVVLDWAKSTPVWQRSARVARQVKSAIQQTLGSEK